MSRRNNLLPHTISSPIKHLEMGLIAADVPLSMKPNTTLQTLEPATKERGALPNDGITRASLLAGSNPQMRRAFSTTLPQSQPAKPLSPAATDAERRRHFKKVLRKGARAAQVGAPKQASTPTEYREGIKSSKSQKSLNVTAGTPKQASTPTEYREGIKSSKSQKSLNVTASRASVSRAQTLKLAGDFAPLLPETALDPENNRSIISLGTAYYYLDLFVGNKASGAKVSDKKLLRALRNTYTLVGVTYEATSGKEYSVALSFVRGGEAQPFATVYVYPFDLVEKERKVVFRPTDSQEAEVTAVFPEIHYLPSKSGTRISLTAGDKPLRGFGTFDFETSAWDSESSEQLVYAYSFTGNGVSFVTHVAEDRGDCKDLAFKIVEEMFRAGLGGYAMYAHNFGRFDSVFILGLAAQIKSKNRAVNILFDSAQRSVISLTIGPAKANQGIPIVFLDSRRVVPNSIKELAPLYGTSPKGDFPHREINLMWLEDESNAPEHLRGGRLLNDIAAYVQQDTKILFEVMDSVNRELQANLGMSVYSHISASGIAKAYYTQRHIPRHRQWRIPTNKYLQDIRDFGYKGGLLQAPGRGKVYKKVYAYDITSMYPSVMLNCPMPSGQLIVINKMRPSDYGFVYILARAPRNKLPCLLPIAPLSKNGSILVNPEKLVCVPYTELFSGFFLTSEVEAAIRYGYKVRVYGGIKCAPHNSGFRSYVTHCFKLRQERRIRGNRAKEQLYKNLLNSLYGRLAIRSRFPQHEFISKQKLNATLKARSTHREVSASLVQGGNYLVRTFPNTLTPLGQTFAEARGRSYDKLTREATIPRKSRSETAVQVAAAITAHSRIVMSSFKDLPGNPIIFSHTDSVVVEHELTDPALLGENEMGKLKFLGVWTDFVVHPENKWYAYKDATGKEHVKTSGRVSNLSHAQLAEAATCPVGRPIVYSSQRHWVRVWNRGTIAVPREGENLVLPRRSVPPSSSPEPSNRIVVGVRFPRLHAILKDPLLIPDHLKATS